MTTVDLRDIFATATDRANPVAPGSIDHITYSTRDELAVRRALLIRDVDGLLAAAGMTRLDEEDD